MKEQYIKLMENAFFNETNNLKDVLIRWDFSDRVLPCLLEDDFVISQSPDKIDIDGYEWYDSIVNFINMEHNKVFLTKVIKFGNKNHLAYLVDTIDSKLNLICILHKKVDLIQDLPKIVKDSVIIGHMLSEDLGDLELGYISLKIPEVHVKNKERLKRILENNKFGVFPKI